MESPTRNQQTDNLTLNQKVPHANVAINQPIDKIIHWDSYSSWNKLVRHIAWITKFKTNWVNKKTLHKQNHRFFIFIAKGLRTQH